MTMAEVHPRHGNTHRLVCAAAALALAAAAVRWQTPALLEATLFVFVLIAGMTLGAIGFLVVGHLLRELWLHPVRDELEPIARSMPLVAILGAPLLAGLDMLYPWASSSVEPSGPATAYLEAETFAIRSIVYVAVWSAAALAVARPGRHRGISIVGLLFLVPTASHAAIDWVASRDPQWISSLFGFSFTVSQGLAALALAMLITLLRQGHPPARRLRSLQSAILSLATLSLWIGFSQFLVVWLADLPREAEWYLDRSAESWTAASRPIALAALIAAIALLVPPRPSRTRIIVTAVLILVQHVAHTIWLVRPLAAGETDYRFALPDLVVPLAMGGLWCVFVALEIRTQPELQPEEKT
jgi:hypothetical protein